MSAQLLTFAGIAVPLILVTLFGPWLWGKAKAAFASFGTARTATAGTITGQQAFDAVMVLSVYQATAKADPTYKAVCAAIKTLEAGE